ncbi:hypothetical protein WN55_03483, partial [Dufourea novaeangliae]
AEGQRKANFEEYEARKYEYAEKITTLKQSVKELYTEYARTRNNEGKSLKVVHMSRESSADGKKRNLSETIAKAQEDNVRLRKRHDLIKYQCEKRQQKLRSLLEEYDQLVNDKMQKLFKKKMDNPLRNKIVKLEVQLEHIRMKQIKANLTRMKYRSMRSDLKEKSVSYASSLKSLEDEIREQENEVKPNFSQDILETLPNDQEEIPSPLHLIEIINGKVDTVIEHLGGPDKYLEVLNEMIVDKLETVSTATTSAEGKATRTTEGQLFSRFPSSATPAAAPSEDEEDVPSRNAVKKQAQQLVDIKSRRKGFAFRR